MSCRDLTTSLCLQLTVSTKFADPRPQAGNRGGGLANEAFAGPGVFLTLAKEFCCWPYCQNVCLSICLSTCSTFDVNSLWPSDARCHCKAWLTLVQAMACCHRQQAIAWTNVDKSSMRSCDIHLRTISQEMPKLIIFDMSLEITNLWLQHLAGASELKSHHFLIFHVSESYFGTSISPTWRWTC